MSINSINFSSSVLGQSVQFLNNELTNLSTQLSTGVKSTNYAGMGVNEGFAIAARSTLSNITAFGDTMTNVNTIISAVNTGLQSLSAISGNILSGASATPQNLDDTGQTSAQESAASQLSALIGILNTQVGSRYIFSGSAINTPAVASADSIMNGTGNLAGLKQVISERQQADLGTDGMGRLVLSQPSSTSVQVAEDVAGSPFGLKLNSVSSSLTGATVSGPSGSPAAVSVDFGTTNPNPGDHVSLTFNLPDGTTQNVTLTATNTSPPPAGSFTIGSTPADTASNFNSALKSSISTLANTSLVAASAIEAGDNFFNTDGIAIGSVASTAAAPVSASTTLSGVGTNSLSSGFTAGDTLNVNGSTIQFYNSSTTPPTTAGAAANTTYVDLATATVGDVLGDIDSITGTTTPSTISGGTVTLNNSAGGVTVTSSNTAALAALGFSGGTVTTAGTASGSTVNNQNTPPAAIAGTTSLSGVAGTDSLASSFGPTDTINVNGKTISFSTTAPTSTSATGGVINLNTGTVQDILTAIDQISGTTTASTISGGKITLNDSAGGVTVTSSNTAAFTALGFSGGTVTTAGTATTGSAVNTSIVPVSGATSLSGAGGTNSLSTSFAAGDTINVDGSTIQFYNSSTTPPTAAGNAANTTYVNLATATVSNLLGDIDKITGSSTPSTISGGVITIHTDDASTLNITSSNPAALQALGFSSSPVTAIEPPLRVSGSPLGSATSLTSGASDTVQWYTGNSASGSARDSSSARIDTSETVDFGAQANEQAIRQQLQNIAVFAAFKTTPNDPNANAQVNDLSQSIVANLSPPAGQQTIADMQTDFANAQTQIQAATARQTQTQTMMQNLVAQTEQVSPDQVASELLSVQNSLQASYQATSMLAQLSLVKFLAPGG